MADKLGSSSYQAGDTGGSHGDYHGVLEAGKGKKVISDNIRTEMHAGKPQKQAIAIAFSVSRRGKKKKK